MQAQNYEMLLHKLDQEHAMALSIKEIPSFIGALIPAKGKKISIEEIIEVIENLQLVVKSGLPLYQGLMDLAQESDNPRLKEMLIHIATEVSRGKSLSAAFEPYKYTLGTMMLNLIKIGEDTGRLEITLKRGASFLRRTNALKKKAKSALIYPSFALFAVTGAMLIWMVYVLPQMSELFVEMGIELPAITLFLMHTSDFLAEYFLYLAAGLVALVILFKLFHKKYMKMRFATDAFILKIPIVHQIVKGFNIAFISEYLRLAFSSGIPIYDSLNTLQKNINNELYKKALQEATDAIASGSQLSSAFGNTKIFSPFTVRMMAVGEAAGTLEDQLALISEYYYEKVDYYAENIGKIIEPVVLIIVGGFMALVMVGLMGPIYDLISDMS